jgi:predicted RNA-binding Zn-ribbon protein involved in translation (DUF1610 family)
MYETWQPHCDDPTGEGQDQLYGLVRCFCLPNCGQEMVFWDVAVDQKPGSISVSWNCPGCGTLVGKSAKKDSGATLKS